MNKIGLIIAREFLTRVKTRAFLISTLLAPVLLSLTILVPVWLAKSDTDTKHVQVLDESGLMANALKSRGSIEYEYVHGDPQKFKQALKAQKKGDGDQGLLYIPKSFSLSNPTGLEYSSRNSMGPNAIEHIEEDIDKQVERLRMTQKGINASQIDSIDASVSVATYKLSDEGTKRSSSGLAQAIGMGAGFLMYFFLFVYGMQVLRGVVEEKTNRIVEVIITSVKPFQLMMGKIIGIAAVGLVQFALWITLSLVASTALSAYLGRKVGSAAAVSSGGSAFGEISASMGSLNVPLLIGIFILYFLLGYAMYAALFAAIGSAVDSETDSQQLLFPVTMPIILSIIIAQMAAQNPDGPVARIFSFIPLTSPIVMMARLAYKDNPLDWEVLLSLGLLILGFFGSVWVAARIYRVGILMYGKKPTLGGIAKWIFYKG